MVHVKRRLRDNKLAIKKIPKTKRVAVATCSKNETPKGAVKTESLPATRDETERANLFNETSRDGIVSSCESAVRMKTNDGKEEVKQNEEEMIDWVECGDEFTEISNGSENADVQEKEEQIEYVEYGDECTEISEETEKADDWSKCDLSRYEENKKNAGSCLEEKESHLVEKAAKGENEGISLQTLSSDFSLQGEEEAFEEAADQCWLVNLITSFYFVENLSNCFHTVDTFCLGTQNLARNVPFECKEEFFLTLADTVDRSPCNPATLRENAAASRAACYDIVDDDILDETEDGNTSFYRTESAGYESVSKDSSTSSAEGKDPELQSSSSQSRLQSDASQENENSHFLCWK